MPRLRRPEALRGDARKLNDALHDLHERAGMPSLAELVRGLGAGVASRSRVHETFSHARLPAWGLLELIVEQLARRVPGGPAPADEVHRFHKLWRAAGRMQAGDERHTTQVVADALLLIIEWVNPPLLPSPSDRLLGHFVDVALTESETDSLVIEKRSQGNSCLVALATDRKTHARVAAAVVSTLNSSVMKDRSVHHYRWPYPQLRVFAHAGPIEYDGEVQLCPTILDMHFHSESMTIRDAHVGDERLPVIFIASSRVIDKPQAEGGRIGDEVWTPVANIPDDGNPLRLWIRAR